jgi:hypothetical protein
MDNYISDDEDDADRRRSASTVVVFAFVYEAAISSRAAAIVRQRLDWTRRVQQLQEEGTFDRTYRMSLMAFNILLGHLRDDLTVDFAHATSSTGVDPIEPEIVLHCLIRWLAGGSYLDIRDAAEISVPSFYRVLHKVLGAVLRCDALRMAFPSSTTAIETTAARFTACSSFGVMNGCIGCLNGMLCRVKTPSRCETRNARAFFSGHYQANGVNVQAVCDDLCRFNYVCVAAPGGTNDVHASAKTKLKQLIDELPVGKYVLADNAYIPTEHLLSPFSGSHKAAPGHDAFNFYLSQLRIKIEQAFGLMTTKWRILRKPLQVKLSNVGNVVIAIARLHNFTITQRPELVTDSIDRLERIGNMDLGFVPSDASVVDIPGSSIPRDRIVRHIRSNALTRPQNNLKRNR